jgi:hypothetical protein
MMLDSVTKVRYNKQMIHSLTLLLNRLDSRGSRELAEFGFFLVVGITAGSLGLI